MQTADVWTQKEGVSNRYALFYMPILNLFFVFFQYVGEGGWIGSLKAQGLTCYGMGEAEAEGV